MQTPLPFPVFDVESTHPNNDHHVLWLLLHGACDLPPLLVGGVPINTVALPLPHAPQPPTAQASVCIGTSTSMVAALGPSAEPTFDPVWNSLVQMRVSADDIAAQSIVRVVLRDVFAALHAPFGPSHGAYRNTAQELCVFEIPLSYLRPYQQYYVELVHPARAPHAAATRLYATLALKARTALSSHTKLISVQPPVNHPSSRVSLELCLKGFSAPLLQSAGLPVGTQPQAGIVAVAKFVTDAEEYAKLMLVAPQVRGSSHT